MNEVPDLIAERVVAHRPAPFLQLGERLDHICCKCHRLAVGQRDLDEVVVIVISHLYAPLRLSLACYREGLVRQAFVTRETPTTTTTSA
jgi:hypothetical protein